MPDIELKTQHCPFTAAQTVCCINTEDMILLCVTLLIILCINMHAWDEENPHVLWRRGYQYRFSTNVWCGIISDFIVGPYVYRGHLSGPGYREFLEQELSLLLEDVPLAERRSSYGTCTMVHLHTPA